MNAQVIRARLLKAIYDTEDRKLFKQAMEKIVEPVPRSQAVSTIEDTLASVMKFRVCP